MKHVLSMSNVLCLCVIDGASCKMRKSAFALHGSVSRAGHAEELATHHKPCCASPVKKCNEYTNGLFIK